MAAITAIDIARESYLQLIKKAEECEEGIDRDTVVHVFADAEQLEEYQAKLAGHSARTHSPDHGGSREAPQDALMPEQRLASRRRSVSFGANSLGLNPLIPVSRSEISALRSWWRTPTAPRSRSTRWLCSRCPCRNDSTAGRTRPRICSPWCPRRATTERSGHLCLSSPI